MHNELKTIIEQAWENRALLQDPAVQQAVRQVVELAVSYTHLTLPTTPYV